MQWQQPAFQSRDRDARRGVGMQHALSIGSCAMDRAMDGVARLVDIIGRVVDYITVEIDLYQIAGGDLIYIGP